MGALCGNMNKLWPAWQTATENPKIWVLLAGTEKAPLETLIETLQGFIQPRIQKYPDVTISYDIDLPDRLTPELLNSLARQLTGHSVVISSLHTSQLSEILNACPEMAPNRLPDAVIFLPPAPMDMGKQIQTFKETYSKHPILFDTAPKQLSPEAPTQSAQSIYSAVMGILAALFSKKLEICLHGIVLQNAANLLPALTAQPA